jgi:rhodanese-related sulfurtransferase
MRFKLIWLFALLVVMSLLLGACGAPATQVAAPPEAITTSAPVVEPTKAPEPTAVPEAREATDDELDAAYSAFLAGMEGYNSLKLVDFQVRLAEEYQPSSADVAPKTKTFLLDVRETSEVEENGHIQGAVLIPLRELGKNLDKLPSFKTPIVAYCASGWRCTIAMAALGALGWEEVYSLKDQSFTGWVEGGNPVMAGLPVKALARNAAKPDPALVATIDKALSGIPDGFGGVEPDKLMVDLADVPGLVLIDVRTPEEIKENGYIGGENSLSIPLEEFIAQRSEWPADKDTPVVIYCGSGHRSTIAMQIMQSYGYTDVRSLKGGLTAWGDAGLQIETANP